MFIKKLLPDLKSTLSLRNSRLSRRLLLYIVLISSFFTLLSTGFQLYMDYRRDVSAIHDYIHFIRASYRQPLAQTAYNMDFQQLELLLRGLLKYRDIEYLEISESLPGGRKILASEGDFESGRDIVYELDLDYPAAPEGTVQSAKLKIGASLEGVYQRLWDKALVVLGSNAVKTFLASLVIFLIIQLVITRHLLRISRYAKEMRLDKGGELLRLSKNRGGLPPGDELDQLADSINALQDRFIQNYEAQRQSEEALRENEKKLSIIYKRSPYAISLSTVEDGKLVDVNEAWTELFGFTLEEARGKTPAELGISRDPEARADLYAEFQDKGLVRHREITTYRTRLHENPVLLCDLEMVEISGIRYVYATARDITEQKSLEQEIRQSREEYKGIFNSMADIFFRTDSKGRITVITPSVTDILGYAPETMIGRQMTEFYRYPKQRKNLLKALSKSGEVKNFQAELIAGDGSFVWISSNASFFRDSEGTVQGVQGVARDITEQKRAEAERNELEAKLRQTQKMEAIGTLAGGIAHDFNNILTAIIGTAQLALDEAGPESALYQDLQEILKAGNRAAGLVRQILTFSRKHKGEKQSLDLEPLIKETVKLLQASLTANIEIIQNVQAETRCVRGDPSQIHQVLMNLCTNAAQAMAETGGSLEVALTMQRLDRRFAARDPDLEPGEYLRLSVSDTGPGISPEVQERIFEPFFTTKPRDKGTGLGLSQVYGIVKEHQGAVSVSSQEGRGTIFQVYLPAELPGQSLSDQPQTIPSSGSERILLVDDENSIVTIGTRMLEGFGYRVTSSTSSLKALELFKASPESFDLVVSDMDMPAMTGLELIARLLAIKPDLPIILCTGFSARITGQSIQELGIRAVLMKPYQANDLGQKVREVLDG